MTIISELPANTELGFGKFYAPLMVEAKFENGKWSEPKIKKLESLELHPGARVLHYAQEIFEGLKVFKHSSGLSTTKYGLFRPQDNIKRMTRSAELMAMPPFPEDAYLESITKLSAELKHLIPEEPGALYLRPTMIGTSSTLGVAAATEYLFYVLACPVGGYFGGLKKGEAAGISVHVTDKYVRAVRGGVGAAKTGANYAASLVAVAEAKKQGYSNVLFLDALERKYFEELSGMNVFYFADGVLNTPLLNDTVLDGITRKSVLSLAKTAGIKTSERNISIQEVVEALKLNKKDIELFACGTGASVSGITELSWKNEKLRVGEGRPGPITTKIYNKLIDIQFGREAHPEWIHPV